MLNLRVLVYLRAVGGESASPAALAPKVGPLGMVFVSYSRNHFLGPQEGGWWYPEGHYGLEGSEDHCEADRCESSGYRAPFNPIWLVGGGGS